MRWKAVRHVLRYEKRFLAYEAKWTSHRLANHAVDVGTRYSECSMYSSPHAISAEHLSEIRGENLTSTR